MLDSSMYTNICEVQFTDVYTSDNAPMPPPALSLIWGGPTLAFPHSGGLGALWRVPYLVTTLLCLLAFAGAATARPDVVRS